jgi:hypothetical protein
MLSPESPIKILLCFKKSEIRNDSIKFSVGFLAALEIFKAFPVNFERSEKSGGKLRSRELSCRLKGDI